MKIKVTQKHIIRARKYINSHPGAHFTDKYTNKCPLALALKEKTRKYVSVGRDGIYIDDTEYDMPSDVRDFISRFDHDDDAVPTAFEIWPKK
jgi:hypothetical protein